MGQDKTGVIAAKKAGVKWHRNALRHSYCSYRLAIVDDASKVALEAGNSPAQIFRHYRALVTPEAADEWFNVFPQKCHQRVITKIRTIKKANE